MVFDVLVIVFSLFLFNAMSEIMLTRKRDGILFPLIILQLTR